MRENLMRKIFRLIIVILILAAISLICAHCPLIYPGQY